MKENSKWGGRKSNIEALRLLSMLMVLNLHSFWGYNHDHGSLTLQAIDFFRESTSICAVNAFILISGYFGIRWKFRSFYNLAFQVLFYSFAVYGVVVMAGIVSYSNSDLIGCFYALSNSYVFVTAYIILYFFSPLLNAFAEKSTDRNLLLYIFVLYLAENFVFRSAGVTNFFLVYLIGRFIQKTKMPERLKINVAYAYWIVTIIIFTLVFTLYLKFHWNAEIMTNAFIAYSYSSPFVILQAVFLFLVFSRFRIQNRFVNWCASSCFAIFLIHMHPAIKNIGYYNFTEGLYNRPVLEHVIVLISLILSVFFFSIFIDKFRIVISDFIYKILEYTYSRMAQKLFVLNSYITKKTLNLI